MIELINLQKMHDSGTVIDIPSLVVRAGEVAAVLGAVDSGREVLFRLLTGEMAPSAGSVRLCGVDPYRDRSAFSRRVGILFPENNLYRRLSVLANLQFIARLHRLPRTRPFEVLEQVGLSDLARINAEKLSTGHSRRLALGRAVLHQPQVYLLAEPFAGCEQASVQTICRLVRGLAKQGASVLVFTQDVSNLEALCDIVHRISLGRISESFDPREETQHHRPFKVPAYGEEKIILIDPADILYAFSQGDRTYLQTAEARLPTRFTLSDLERRLSRSGFFRTHRAYLVNLQQVWEVIPFTRDSFSLRLKDAAGTEIPLSKSAERELRQLLDY